MVGLSAIYKSHTVKTIFIGFVFLILIFTPGTLPAQNFWQEISVMQNLDVRDIEVDSQGRIYLAFYDALNGGILSSDDNCLSWQQNNNGLDAHTIRDLTFKNDSNIFIVGDFGVYRSTDRANSWELMYKPAYNDWWQFNAIKFGYDSILLVSGGRGKAILRSTDDGETWTEVLNLYNTDFYEWVTDILFGPDNVIYACSRFTNNWSNNNPNIYYSTDYGKSWSVFYDPQTPCGFIKLKFNNSGKLMAGAFDAVYMYDFTTASWEYYPYNTIVSDFLVVPDNRVFLAGNSLGGGWGGVALSYDDGISYPITLNSGLPYGNANEFAVDITGRLLMQNHNHLFRSNDTIFTQVEVNPEVKQLLVKIYPNPFHEYVTIESGTEKQLKLSLFNSSGQLIKSETLPAFGELCLNANQLQPGIFILKLETEKQLQSIKLIHY